MVEITALQRQAISTQIYLDVTAHEKGNATAYDLKGHNCANWAYDVIFRGLTNAVAKARARGQTLPSPVAADKENIGPDHIFSPKDVREWLDNTLEGQ